MCRRVDVGVDVWEGGCVGGWEVGWVDVWDKWMREDTVDVWGK